MQFLRWLGKSLVRQILLAMLLGILIGRILMQTGTPQPEGTYIVPAAEYFQILGDFFTKALRAVAPILVFILITHAISRHQQGQARGLKTILVLYVIGTFAAAAVADYRVAQPAAHKQKKQGDSGLTLQLVQNPDIVATIAALRENRPYTVGFAAETDNVLAYARDKRARKNLDLIIANDVSRDVFGADDNAATLIAADGETTLPRQAKTTLADSVLTHILSHWKKT